MGVCVALRKRTGLQVSQLGVGSIALGKSFSFFWIMDFSCTKQEDGTQFFKFLANNKILGFGECLLPAF